MIIPNIAELSLLEVWDRGVPNKECLAIGVNESVDMTQFALLAGTLSPQGGLIPHPDHFLWFGGAVVNAGDFIFVYTGSGEPRGTKAVNGTNDVYTVFWNRPKTVFANSAVIPALIKFGEVELLSSPTDLPQGSPQLSLGGV